MIVIRYSGEGNIPEIANELSNRAKNIDPLEVAIEVFDSATTLANSGNIDDAVPLYLHVSHSPTIRRIIIIVMFFLIGTSNL